MSKPSAPPVPCRPPLPSAPPEPAHVRSGELSLSIADRCAVVNADVSSSLAGT